MIHLRDRGYDQTNIGNIQIQFFAFRLWRCGIRYQRETGAYPSRVLALPFCSIRVFG